MARQIKRRETQLVVTSLSSSRVAGAERPYPSTEDAQLTLPTVLSLLDALNHRHRNQHHASHWWSTFGSLRRSLRTLVKLLDKQALDNRGGCTEHISTSAFFLISQVLPRAFISFSQLAADNQHAPLGLLLLAVLGRLHDLLVELVPQYTLLSHPEQPREDSQRRGSAGKTAATFTVECMDRGVVISREATLGAETPAATAGEVLMKADTKNPDMDFGDLYKGQAKARKKRNDKKSHQQQHKDALSDLFGSLC